MTQLIHPTCTSPSVHLLIPWFQHWHLYHTHQFTDFLETRYEKRAARSFRFGTFNSLLQHYQHGSSAAFRCVQLPAPFIEGPYVLYGDILEHYWSEIFWCYDQRL